MLFIDKFFRKFSFFSFCLESTRLLQMEAPSTEPTPRVEAPNNPDPEVDMKPPVIYRCKKCRRIVASHDLVVPHEPGDGQKCFKWKKRNKSPEDDNLPKCSSIFVEPMKWMETC